MTVDFRKLPRRRGEALHTAILQATLDELAEVGYQRLTMARVAERAGTGKAALYRRWPTRVELVIDAVSHLLPDPDSLPDTGNLRDDLLVVLRWHAQALAGPGGEALRGLLSDAMRDPERTVDLRTRSRGRGRKSLETVVHRAAARGEIDPSSITPTRLEAGRALLREYFLFHGAPVPDEMIVTIVDEVVLPLLRGCPRRLEPSEGAGP